MKKKKKWILRGFAALIALAVLFAGAFYIVFDVGSWQKLDHDRLVKQAQTTSIFDRNGTLLSEIRGHENRTVISLSEIPLLTQRAFIAAEDLRFYEHRGIDVFRILGALRNNLKTRSLAEGASTITQQLAKLTHLSPEKTIRRKLEEISLALQIENAYTKDEILEMYLNTVYFGRGAYGIQAAAKTYFGIDASALTLAQSAALAAAIKAPSAYAPHTNPQNNKDRRIYILNTMEENGFITSEECRRAKSESIWVIAAQKHQEIGNWYVDEVLRESSNLLGISADDVISGGFQIYTAFDPKLQRIADTIYQDTALFPSNASDGTKIQSAMSVIDTESGAILAMIGGREYATKRGLNRATQMRRQPGSVLKPLSVYGPALEQGYTTASVLLDEKTSFSGGYTPENAGGRYYGWVTMRTALRNSLNTTAVRLLEEIGLDHAIDYLSKMGIPADKSDRNLSLALGSMTYGVTPVELAAAYAAFANGGIYHVPYCIDRILSAEEEMLYENKNDGKRVISEQNAYLMTSMLQSVITNGTGTRLLSAGIPLAGKTGTVSMQGGNRDIWMAAFNTELSVSVWMGYDQSDRNHRIPNGITGGKNTASIAAAFFKEAYAGEKKPEFVQPEGLVWLTLDKRAVTARGSVMLASKSTPESQRFSEVFAVGNRPYAVSDLWNAPSPPSSFYVTHDHNGFPELRFSTEKSVRYRIQRDAVGESVILTELVGSRNETISYHDYTAQPDVLYTYRIIPIHEELLQQGIWLEGKQAVQLASVAQSSESRFLAGIRSLFPALSGAYEQ